LKIAIDLSQLSDYRAALTDSPRILAATLDLNAHELRFRMKKLSLATLAIAVAVAFAAAALAGNDNETQVLDQISGYRQWTKVNADPVKVEIATDGTGAPISWAAS